MLVGYRRRVAALSPLQHLRDSEREMERIESALMASATTDDEFLTEVASHLIVAGGKRLRPAFVVASALATEAEPAVSEDLVQAAISVELVHLGSLYHDDVMDDADIRRTVDSVNARWGNLKAILAGDFLLAKASEIAAGLGTDVAQLLAATIGWLCEGQVRELQRIYDLGRTEDQYLQAIDGKTAALYSTACRIGGLVADRPAEEIDRLTEFGRAYGMAFQVVDDILDLVASEDILGKPGNDLVEGVYTLPVIRYLSAEPDGELADLLGRPLTEAERDKAKGLIRDSTTIASAIDTALAYTREALAIVEPMAPTPASRGLADAARNLLSSLPLDTSAGSANTG